MADQQIDSGSTGTTGSTGADANANANTGTTGGDAGAADAGQTGGTQQNDTGKTGADAGTKQADSKADDATKTVLDTTGPNDKTTNVTGDFPDDWREKAAGGDEKKLNLLKRLASPKAMADAYFEAQQKIRSGLAKQITAESTPEEIAEFRKANGIPEASDKYDLNLGDGYVIGENDKPQVDQFLKVAHENNMTDAQAKAALKTYFSMQQQSNTAYLQKQAEFKETALTELRKEFGQQYDRNINLLKGYVENQFGDSADAILSAVDTTGTPLMNRPDVIRKFLSIALDHDPVGATLPGLGMQGKDTVENEIKTIETRIKTDRKGYFADQKAQDRYGQLLEMRTRFQKRA